ncbi:flagellar brake protein [Candidatus Clostridium radicumherbarum]|uniref:Flagellar brake protein n=1 Tax=Candidatus Clostridium radicumherbarum TaxID=3381662 RepID=A0ABW8TTM5_9CLOT
MDNELLEGDFLVLDEQSLAKTVYLFLRHEVIHVVKEDPKGFEEEEIKAQVYSLENECEGEIIKIYKNNLVIAVSVKNIDLFRDYENINIRITNSSCAYECSSKILGLKEEGDKLILVLSTPLIEKKVDRRRFFRINLKFGVRYCILPKGNYNTILDIPKGCFLKIKKALTKDISAGGISILAEDKCEVGDYVLVCLYLPNKFDVLCKILRIDPNYKNGTSSLLCMKYVYIHEIDRDRVAGFVIKNEISRRNKIKKTST